MSITTQYEGILSEVDSEGNVQEMYPLVHTDTSLTLSGRPADSASVGIALDAMNANIRLKLTGKSYESYEDMVSSLQENQDEGLLNVGQDIYILTQNVPDLWVYKVEEESIEYTYVDDETIINTIKENGYIQIGYYKLSIIETEKVEVDLSMLIITRGILTAGETEITINDDRITENSVMSFFTSIYGVNPVEVVTNTGSVTLTFDVQEIDMEVGVRVDG